MKGFTAHSELRMEIRRNLKKRQKGHLSGTLSPRAGEWRRPRAPLCRGRRQELPGKPQGTACGWTPARVLSATLRAGRRPGYAVTVPVLGGNTCSWLPVLGVSEIKTEGQFHGSKNQLHDDRPRPSFSSPPSAKHHWLTFPLPFPINLPASPEHTVKRRD